MAQRSAELKAQNIQDDLYYLETVIENEGLKAMLGKFKEAKVKHDQGIVRFLNDPNMKNWQNIEAQIDGQFNRSRRRENQGEFFRKVLQP